MKRKNAHPKACENLFCWRECAGREREREVFNAAAREKAPRGGPTGNDG